MKLINFLIRESNNDKHALLKKHEADLAELPKHPNTEAGYEAIDELKDKIAKLKKELSISEGSEQSEPELIYATRMNNIEKMVQQLPVLLQQHQLKFQQNPRDWGFPGDLASIEKDLKDLVDRLAGTGEYSK